MNANQKLEWGQWRPFFVLRVVGATTPQRLSETGNTRTANSGYETCGKRRSGRPYLGFLYPHYVVTEHQKRPKFENTCRILKALGEGVIMVFARKATPSWSRRYGWTRSRSMPAMGAEFCCLIFEGDSKSICWAHCWAHFECLTLKSKKANQLIGLSACFRWRARSDSNARPLGS